MSMPRISYAFFALSALCGLSGMVWGIVMGASQDFATAPAHAHLNLLGWLGLAVMGTFYAIGGRGVPPLLARANLLLSGVAAVMLPVGVARITLGHADGEPLAIVGGMVALAGMASFLAAILLGWSRAARA